MHEIAYYQYTLGGVDVSKNQGTIAWDVLAESARFVVIRAGLGLRDDVLFYRNWPEARRVKLPRASYWYLWPGISGKSQADKFLQALAVDQGEMGVFTDMEEKEEAKRIKFTPDNYLNLAGEMLRPLDARFGVRRVGIYSSEGFWNSWMPYNASAELQVALRPKWVANYTLASSPQLPRGWSSFDLWQYSADRPPTQNTLGREFGCQSTAIDLDVFRGNESEFRSLFGCDPKVVGSAGPVRKVVAMGAINIRSKPDETGLLRGSISGNSDWTVLETVKDARGRTWYRIADSSYVAGWLVRAVRQ